MRSAEEKYTHHAIVEIPDTVQMDNMSFIVYKSYFPSIFSPVNLRSYQSVSRPPFCSSAMLSASLQP